jgi:CheY-like chemotaxis protein
LILIVEDEEYNYQVIAAYFKSTKAQIQWVKNGKEAIDFVNKSKPDIVLMDIKMPVMDGKEATKRLKYAFPELIIIAQTAYARSEEIDDFMLYGFNDFIIKPFKKEELLDVILKNLNKQ